MASMLLKPVFQATIGFLINKGRGLVAEKLKDGDVADEKFRKLIVREIDDIKSKLDGLARKDLAASISFFKDGVVHLGKVLDVETAGNEGRDAVSTQADGAVGGGEEKTLLLATKEMKNLQLTGLNEEAKETLSDAKGRFKDARRKAVEAFGTSALSTSDRLLAMSIRIMATVLEKVDNPASALASCRLCLEELHSYSAVRANFIAELKKGIMESIKSNFGSDERNEVIVAVCQMNRVVYDVTQMVDEDVSKARELLIWPCVDVGEERIDPLRDSRIAKKLRKLGMEQFHIQPWSFGQEGKEEHRLETVEGIAMNTNGQFIIAEGKYVKVFDSSGNFLRSFSPPYDGWIEDVATDQDDNMYVLVQVEDEFHGGGDVYVFDTQAKLHHSFRIRPGYIPTSVVVDVSNKVLVSVTEVRPERRHVSYDFLSDESDLVKGGRKGLRRKQEVMVEVYENRRLLHRIEVCWSLNRCLLSTTGDGHVMVLDSDSHTLYLFSPQEDYPLEKKVQLRQRSPVAMTIHKRLRDISQDRQDIPAAMTFHQGSEHLFIASFNKESEGLQVSLYKKDGQFVRSIPLDLMTEPGRHYTIKGIVVTNNGQIAIAVQEYFWGDDYKFKNKHIILIV